MTSDSYSCIKEVTKTVHVALPSLYISNEFAGITDVLETWKRQYVPQLQGVLVSYKNVVLTTSAGLIVNDKPVVHYNVRATFDLFCPTIGSIVMGKINRISHDHVGCLVHGTINVAIKLQNDGLEELKHYLVLDRSVLFRITCFSFHRRVIRVRGEITEECVALMKEDPSFSVQNDVQMNHRTIYSSSEESEHEFTVDTPKSVAGMEFSDEDSKDSQSLLAPNYTVVKNSSVFNCDHLADGHGFSTSNDSDFMESHVSLTKIKASSSNVDFEQVNSVSHKKKKHKSKEKLLTKGSSVKSKKLKSKLAIESPEKGKTVNKELMVKKLKSPKKESAVNVDEVVKVQPSLFEPSESETKKSLKRKHRTGKSEGKPKKKRKINDEVLEPVSKEEKKSRKKGKSRKKDKDKEKINKKDKSKKKEKGRKKEHKKIKSEKDLSDHKHKTKKGKKSKSKKTLQLKTEMKEEV